MTYRIQGLDPEPFRLLFAMPDEELAARNARRVIARGSGYPCRVSLQDAEDGEEPVLVNFVSHDAATPFRSSHAIFVRRGAARAPVYESRMPSLLDRRTLSLRAFDAEGMLLAGTIAAPGEGDARVRDLFDNKAVVAIHAHNAAMGCFLAKIERD